MLVVAIETRRERKKRQTRDAITTAAFGLFAERGYEAVTVAEIAERADVARATFFSHFPTKDAIVLEAVGDDDPAVIVAARSPGTTPLAALRAHYGAFARTAATRSSADLVEPGGESDLLTRVRVITESPTLRAAVGRLEDRQREALAAVLAGEARAGERDLPTDLAAAQICATIGALKSRFFARLARGETVEAAAGLLPAEVELAFDLLERGLAGDAPEVDREA